MERQRERNYGNTLAGVKDGEEGGQVERDGSAGDGEVWGGDAVLAVLVAAVGGAVGGVEGPDVRDSESDVLIDFFLEALPGVFR